MPSIALVVNAFPRLSESFIANQARLLVNSGYEVTMIVHDLKSDALHADLADRVRVRAAPSAYSGWRRGWLVARALLRSPAACAMLWRELAEAGIKRRLKAMELYAPFAGERFDMVHFAFSGLGVTYLPILFFLKKKSKLYVSCRGHAERIRPLSDPARREALRALFALINRTHCVSEDMRHTCATYGLDPAKAFVNRPAIDPVLFRVAAGAGSERVWEEGVDMRIAVVGRLNWQKGFETLLQAFQILLSNGIKAHLEIAGEGPEREKLVFLAHLLGVAQRVIFRGALAHADIRELLANAHVYAHSSVSEGISNAVMEAMAMELPVVCTDVGGMSELITDSVDGFLVPALNPEAMADKLILLAQDEKLRKKLGQNARLKILKDFSLERQRDVYLTEYANAIATRS